MYDNDAEHQDGAGTERQLSAARYERAIDTMADEIEAYVLDHPDEQHDVGGYIHEEVDNSELVIYTAYHLDVLAHTEHEPDDDLVLVGVDTFDDVLQSAAYDVMTQDLAAELRERDSEVLN